MSDTSDFMSFNISHWTSGKNSSTIFCNVQPEKNRATFVVEYQTRKYFDCKDFKKAMQLFKQLERMSISPEDLLKRK